MRLEFDFGISKAYMKTLVSRSALSLMLMLKSLQVLLELFWASASLFVSFDPLPQVFFIQKPRVNGVLHNSCSDGFRLGVEKPQPNHLLKELSFNPSKLQRQSSVQRVLDPNFIVAQ